MDIKEYFLLNYMEISDKPEFKSSTENSFAVNELKYRDSQITVKEEAGG